MNRVGDQYFDQLENNGHADRLDDLDRFAALGISALRYPVLWERVAPNGVADWGWTDERLGRLRELHIHPIAGLLHHGSGPRHTSLIDPAFPDKLADYARTVAERYPWLDRYTPINEPLTTARFSGLYGHWYPHGRDEVTFIRALLTQCRAIALAMQAIRQVNPQAQLVQTEDLGKTYSTPELAYQAEFENHRRWLSLDLLCGRLDQNHPLWNYLRWVGVEQAELEWFLAHPCPPDIVGINHYLTSDRWLDQRLDHYPPHTHGSNGKHAYADVEAVRVRVEGITGHQDLLQEVWDRYQLPIAITEVHLGCTREEQLRWLQEVWDAAHALRSKSVDVRAIAVWSLLGAYDWNSLLTRADRHYEPGVFDLRPTSDSLTSAIPRATALAKMVRGMAQGERFLHPLLEIPGWWRHSDRLLYPPVSSPVSCPPTSSKPAAYPTASSNQVKSIRPIVITGATGTLGQAFARICDGRGIPYRLLSRQEMDITQPASVQQTLKEINPWAVINAAGYVRVDDAEREQQQCWLINTEGAEILAKTCFQQGVAFVTFSSDLVFDGSQKSPYLESSSTSPLNQYGYSKAIAEQYVLAAHPRSLVIRTSAFFSPWDDYNFLTVALRALTTHNRFVAADDAVVSPTYVPDLVHATLDLLIDDEVGVWHLANQGAIDWADLARNVAGRAGLAQANVESCSTKSLGLTAARPSYSVLGSERGILLPSLEVAIDRYFQDRKETGLVSP
ncbi:MAG TPA: family 1 glycosylhydrolase [Thermosynechococcaceae cyanobacterium]